MDVERQIDGFVGRLLSWLTQPPVRPVVSDDEPAVAGAKEKPVPRKVTAKRRAAKRPAAKKPAAKQATAAKKPARKKPAAKKPAAKKPAAKRTAAKKPAPKAAAKKRAVKKPAPKAPAADLDRFVEGAGRAAPASGDLAAKILAALAGSAEGATLAELQKATGGQLAAVRKQLNQLLKAGKIQRGQGIGTRYRLS